MRQNIIQISIALLCVVAMIYGNPVSFPDNVHTAHGLPLTWGVHQHVTIAGPGDTWRVDLVNLALDLVFWLGVVIVAPLMRRGV